MKSRAGQYLLCVSLASLALVLPQLSPLSASAQNAGRGRDDDEQRRPRQDREDGDGERRGGLSRRNGDGGSWQRNRGMGRSRDRDRDDDDEGGGNRDNARRPRNEEGGRGDRADRSQNSSPTAPPAGGAAASSSLSAESYARGLIRKYDKNGDNMLQADERGGLNRTNASTDSNKDGVITADELITAQSGNAPAPAPAAESKSDEKASDTPPKEGEDEERQPRPDRGDRGRGRGGDNNGGEKSEDRKVDGSNGASGTRRVYTSSAGSGKSKEAADARRTYRFTPAAERLPSGLSSSFKSRDRNGDGQIAMSEFSRTWSKRTVADFQRHDLNGDGIITPKEAVKSDWR